MTFLMTLRLWRKGVFSQVRSTFLILAGSRRGLRTHRYTLTPVSSFSRPVTPALRDERRAKSCSDYFVNMVRPSAASTSRWRK